MFDRKVTVQVHDAFPPGSDISEIVAFIKAQRVPGEIRISLSGNGGITSVIFDGKPVVHRGAIREI